MQSQVLILRFAYLKTAIIFYSTILDYQQLFWEMCRAKMEIESVMDTNGFGLVSCYLLFISYNDLAFIKNTLTGPLATLVSFESLSQDERKQT